MVAQVAAPRENNDPMYSLWRNGEPRSDLQFFRQSEVYSLMTVSWIVTGLGIIVSLLGYYLTPSAWGYGILGFGLAHVLLGILDMFRAPARNR